MVNVKKLLTLGVLLVLGGMAVAQPGQVVSSGFAGQVNQVRVMSFNIRYGLADDGADSWPLRQDLVVRTIRDFEPQLLGVQECLDFQGQVLRDSLPGYGFVGVGRDDGKLQGEMCGVFWQESFFEKLDAGHFWLSPEPDEVSSVGWDAALTRMATWVKLRTRTGDPVTFVFCNTHFDHVGQQARRESARIIHTQLKKVAGKLAVILVGDFNAPADPAADGPYHFLVKTRGWQDTYRRVREPALDEGTFNGFRGETGGARIDWILTRPDLGVVSAGIVRAEREGRYPSDHFPVTATIELR
jgi:endonuclease/exonuclease/phosphatase family metal-dependent hydrolase